MPPRSNGSTSTAPFGSSEYLRGIPYPPTRTAPRPTLTNTVLASKEYRTHRQGIPYRPANPPPFGADRPSSETIVSKSPAKAAIIPHMDARRTIPYSPTSTTVPVSKEYRTLRQVLPYRPAKNTVLSNKEYRTE